MPDPASHPPHRRRLVLRAAVLVAGVLVLSATSAPRPATLAAAAPAGAGETDADGRAQIVVTLSAAAVDATDESQLTITVSELPADLTPTPEPAPDAEPAAAEPAAELAPGAEAAPDAEAAPAAEPAPARAALAGTVSQRGLEQTHDVGGAHGNTLRLSAFHQACGEVDDDDEGPGCVIVFDTAFNRPAILTAELSATSRSSPGFPFSGNGHFPEDARITVEIRGAP